MTAGRLLPYGETAVLVEIEQAHDVIGLRDALRRLATAPDRAASTAAVSPTRSSPVRAVVPAARTVLVEFDPRCTTRSWVQELIEEALAATGAGTEPLAAAVVQLEVQYDGADLTSVAAELAESIEAVIARHTEPEYLVQFCGFSPGFAYLTGLDPKLRLPRLATPRPSVPAGSVAVAGEYTGVYPRPSPGGWLLLGHTDQVLFDAARAQPALLSPGTRVRFVAR
ncbi:5-oxoprolinase subunit B family protein [Jatrophihabitans sp. DSM 45814]